MRTSCPIIFAKLDFFATMSEMGVAYSALKIFRDETGRNCSQDVYLLSCTLL